MTLYNTIEHIVTETGLFPVAIMLGTILAILYYLHDNGIL